MNVAVMMPYRGVDRWRKRAQEAAEAQARLLGWPVLVADSGDEPFSIGRTWNRLAELADQGGRWDVAVRWAADMLAEDIGSVRAAVEQVNHYTVAFDRTTSLTAAETRAVYAGEPPPRRDDELAYGGITVITLGRPSHSTSQPACRSALPCSRAAASLGHGSEQIEVASALLMLGWVTGDHPRSTPAP